MIRTRKNVLNLPAGDDTLLWYGKAIAAMQSKPIAEPTSWRYQAAIHDYIRSDDPHASSTDKLPSKSNQNEFWAQCQHGSWYFLPWHRMYLHFFEQIVLSEIKALGGPANWALPYWNYSASTAAALLPAPFRHSKLPNKSKNPLYVSQRDPNANKGLAIATATDTDISYCLQRTKFPGGNFGGSAGFGGPVTNFQHSGGVTGSTEAIPHGSMHMAVAGNTGWMGAFTTAPLDPIFWLHHCNLDRLWEVWLKRDPAHANPATSNWLNSVSFDFNDASGKVVSMTPADVVNTTASPLEYSYDDTSDPLGPTAPPNTMFAGAAIPAPGPRPSEKAIMAEPETPAPVPEMIGATSSAFKLAKDVTEKPISVHKAAGPAALEAVGQPRRVFLHVEGITSKARSVPYDVYLNLPPGAKPQNHPELRAGRLPMFGLVEASRSGGKHPNTGLHYTLEITRLYHRLAAEPDWKRDQLRVSLVPAKPGGPTGAKVGRISLYLQ